jgi:hypothetical protein
MARSLAQALGPEALIAVLYGPMISEEIRAGRPAFTQAGAAQAGTFARLFDLVGELRAGHGKVADEKFLTVSWRA